MLESLLWLVLLMLCLAFFLLKIKEIAARLDAKQKITLTFWGLLTLVILSLGLLVNQSIVHGSGDTIKRSVKTYLGEWSGRNYYHIKSSPGVLMYYDNSEWNVTNPYFSNGKVWFTPYDLRVVVSDKPAFEYRSKESGWYNVSLEASYYSDGKQAFGNASAEIEVTRTRYLWKDYYKDTDVFIDIKSDKIIFGRIIKSKYSPVKYVLNIDGSDGRSKLVDYAYAVDGNFNQVGMTIENFPGWRAETIILSGNEVYPIYDALTISENPEAEADDGYIRMAFSQYRNALPELYVGRFTTFGNTELVVRFPITLPGNAIINTANATFGVGNYSTDNVNTRMMAENSYNATQITGAPNDMSDFLSRVLTDNITYDAVEHTVAGVDHTTPDFASVVQQVIDDNSGIGGYFQFFWGDREGRSTLDVYRFMADYGHPFGDPVIDIVYYIDAVSEPIDLELVQTGINQVTANWSALDASDFYTLVVNTSVPTSNSSDYLVYSGNLTNAVVNGMDLNSTVYEFSLFNQYKGIVSSAYINESIGGDDLEITLAISGFYLLLAFSLVLLMIAAIVKKVFLYIALIPAWIGVIALSAGHEDTEAIQAAAAVVFIFAVVQIRNIKRGNLA